MGNSNLQLHSKYIKDSTFIDNNLTQKKVHLQDSWNSHEKVVRKSHQWLTYASFLSFFFSIGILHFQVFENFTRVVCQTWNSLEENLPTNWLKFTLKKIRKINMSCIFILFFFN